LFFVTEARFVRVDKHTVYSIDGSFSNYLWARYLESFDEIIVFARVKNDPNYKGNKEYLASSVRVRFHDCPYYIGLFDFLKNYRKIQSLISRELVNRKFIYLFRVPGFISNIFTKELWRQNIPYGLEVVGDPWEVFAPGTIKHPLRPLLRILNFYLLKLQVRRAAAVLYVTKSQLQKRYPTNRGVFTTHASNVMLNNESYSLTPKIYKEKGEYIIISVGSLEQLYKAPDLVLKTIKSLNISGVNAKLIWLGDGKYFNDLIELSVSLGINDKVNFVGNVSKELVVNYLDESDLFLMASRTEGIPRALIEAMARGLPCVGTNVGGIPELLNKENLVKVDDISTLAKRITVLLKNENEYNIAAGRNWEFSKNFENSILQMRRKGFYDFLIGNAKFNAYTSFNKN